MHECTHGKASYYLHASVCQLTVLCVTACERACAVPCVRVAHRYAHAGCIISMCPRCRPVCVGSVLRGCLHVSASAFVEASQRQAEEHGQRVQGPAKGS